MADTSERVSNRLVLTIVAVPTVFLGIAISPLVQLVVLVALVGAGAIADTVLAEAPRPNPALPRRGREHV